MFQVVKRDGEIADFQMAKISSAIHKAFDAKKTLIITGESNEVLYKSARNIADVQIMPVNNINVYDLLKFEKLIITKDAVSKIEEVYA